jgi:thiamine-phosphate pyrophosphorylase
VSAEDPSVIPTLEPFRVARPWTPAERAEVVAAHTPALMLVTDWLHLDGRDAYDVVDSAVSGGATMIYFRDSLEQESARPPLGATNDRRAWYQLFEILAKHVEEAGLKCVVLVSLKFTRTGLSSARLIAHVRESEGQHATLISLRERYGEDQFFSASVHSIEAALQAERDGADMLVLGTVFPSTSHPAGTTIGLAGVREVCAAVSIPVIGIGGITAQNAGDVIRAGASGVAVISAIFDAPDPRVAAAELRAAIDAAWAERHTPPSDKGRGQGVR